jgi:cell division protein FtsI (penicillin-binding protein 3)
MSSESAKNPRLLPNKFPPVIIIMILICGGIIYHMVMTAVVERDKWIEMRQQYFEKDSVELQPTRGNILSDEGQLMASSLPNYKVHFDFMAGLPKDSSDQKVHVRYLKALHERDSLIRTHIPAISKGLADICPALDSAGYVRHLTKGLDERRRYYDVCPGYILNYIQFQELKKLPVFNIKNKYQSGLTVDERNNRKKPFESLARRMLGDMYALEPRGKSGIEHAYDSLLRGEPGLMRRRRIRSKNVTIVDREPVPGYDVISTINVGLQDICENALREKLIELDAEFGVVVLMEVKTGDVKAIVNLERDTVLGRYYDRRNYALTSLMEPGSTFKIASVMVAIDDGEITAHDPVDVGNGVYNMHGAMMKDAGWYKNGGAGLIDVAEAVQRSSNVGVSKVIDAHYHNKPEKFIEGLKRVGIGTPLGLPFEGTANPRIVGPNDPHVYWSGPSLAWLSIGYGSMIPPISTVAFYNAIANGGKMVRPRFVKGLSRNGEVVEEFPVEVLKEQICKPSTLKDIREMMWRVVNAKQHATGRLAGSKHFVVAGKTGTAQVAEGGGYHSGRQRHLVSFCGFYPYENPQYTCIVAIRTAAPGASGGRMAGTVFAKIAESVYSKSPTSNLNFVRDSAAVATPDVKSGCLASARSALKWMRVPVRHAGSKSGWGTASIVEGEVVLQSDSASADRVPDLSGMGARDAVYAIESRGMKARVRGCGKVESQSVAAGSKVVRGRTVHITLG